MKREGAELEAALGIVSYTTSSPTARLLGDHYMSCCNAISVYVVVVASKCDWTEIKIRR